MIRKLAALGAACAVACAPIAAMAATVGPASLSNGALSPALSVTANATLSISLPGPTPIDASASGKNLSQTCFTVMRSQDGVNFAPLTRDATGAFAHYCGPISVDLIENRSGTSYAIQADPNAASFIYRIDQ